MINYPIEDAQMGPVKMSLSCVSVCATNVEDDFHLLIGCSFKRMAWLRALQELELVHRSPSHRHAAYSVLEIEREIGDLKLHSIRKRRLCLKSKATQIWSSKEKVWCIMLLLDHNATKPAGRRSILPLIGLIWAAIWQVHWQCIMEERLWIHESC